MVILELTDIRVSIPTVLRRGVYVYWACSIVMASAVLITYATTIFKVLHVHVRHNKA